MDQIITFDKSYQQRLQEYMDVLSGYEILAASQVKKEWGFYLEMAIDPNGWQAVWKIPRLVCEKCKIIYPTIVLVYIENINFRDLTAFVKILAVQDDMHLPESHIVPLIQLWPTKQQDDTVGLNLQVTANAIDMLHFFFNHLWMPWDIDDKENVDWISKHLEIRLRLYYDIKMSIIPRNTAEHLRSLVTEAKALQVKRETLEEELKDEDDIDVDLTFNSDDKNVLNESVQTLMDFHVRLTQIKSEVKILENPVLRSVLLRRHKKDCTQDQENEFVHPQNWLIFKSGATADSYIEYINKVKEEIPGDGSFKTATSLQNALEAANPKDTLLISIGKHNIKSSCSFEEGGTIKGLFSDKSETEVTSSNENIMLDFSGENVHLENLFINAGLSQCGILVRKGKVTLQNCLIKGKGESAIHQGIIVLPEAELHLENCDLSGFATGVVANSGSKISIQNCTITNVEIAVKLYDKAIVNMQKSTFSTCKQYGIYVERDLEQVTDEQIVGDMAILECIPEINAADCKFSSNGKGDVIITKVQRILPVRDLFSNPKFDMTLNSSYFDQGDNENMEM